MEKVEHLKSNGYFSILRGPFAQDQHPNQQGGLDLYVDVIDHSTGNVNNVKLYANKQGKLYFKKNGSWYLELFTQTFTYIPFQMIEED